MLSLQYVKFPGIFSETLLIRVSTWGSLHGGMQSP